MRMGILHEIKDINKNNVIENLPCAVHTHAKQVQTVAKDCTKMEKKIAVCVILHNYP